VRVGGARQVGMFVTLYCTHSYVHLSTYFQAAACGGESGFASLPESDVLPAAMQSKGAPNPNISFFSVMSKYP